MYTSSVCLSLICPETPQQVHMVDIRDNTLSEGSSINFNFYLSITREQMNQGDPVLYQVNSLHGYMYNT